MKNRIKLATFLLVGTLGASQAYGMNGFTYDGSQTVSAYIPSSSSSSYTSTARIFTAPDNSLYTVTTLSGAANMDFDGGPGEDLFYTTGIYLTKRNPDGSYAWTTPVNTGAITADASGNIYLMGALTQTTDLDPTVTEDFRTPVGNKDIYITKLNANLDYVWSRTMGGTDAWINSGDIAVDGQGNVVVTGYFQGTVGFDFPDNLDQHTSVFDGALITQDLFVSKINHDGSYGWTQVYATNKDEGGRRVVLDATDNIYVMSGEPTQNEPELNTMALFKYDSAGTSVWSGSVTGYDTWGNDMTISGDALYIAGNFRSTTDFDPTAGVDSIAPNNSSAFLTKVYTDGSYGWTRTFGGSVEIYGRGVAANGLGDVFIVGYFRNTVDFNPDATLEEHTAAAYFDLFYSHYKADGSYMGTNTLGWSANDYAFDATTDGNNNFYLAGQANGSAFAGAGSGDWDFDPGIGVDVQPVNAKGSGYFTKWQADSVPVDLALSNISTIRSAVYRGETITFSATVDNTGGQAVSGVTVDYYLSTDANIGTDDYLLSSATIASLSAGQSTTLDVSALIDMPVGTYYLGAIVDPANTIAEGNETNNSIVGNTVGVSLSPTAEQVVTALSAPAQAGVLGTFDVDFTLTNFGSIAASGYGNGSSYWAIYISQDAEITTSDLRIMYGGIYEQAAESSVNLSRTITLPSSITTGNYYVGVITDYLNSVTENDEANNTASTPLLVVSNDVDLQMINSITSNPTTLSQGEYTRIFSTVQNNGSNTATNVKVDYFLSTDSTITTGDIYLGSSTISSIAAGSSVADDLIALVNATAGTYYLGAIVDVANSIAESDETNNAHSGSTIVVTQ